VLTYKKPLTCIAFFGIWSTYFTTMVLLTLI